MSKAEQEINEEWTNEVLTLINQLISVTNKRDRGLTLLLLEELECTKNPINSKPLKKSGRKNTCPSSKKLNVE